jgi:hypothetical protein
LLNLQNDLYLCGIYIPPEKTTYFDTEIFDNLENEITSFSEKGDVMLVGDFNARTGKLNDFIPYEGDQHIPGPTQNNNNEMTRENFDNTINDHGKILIEICKSCNLRILNGRTKGDSLGKPTFHCKNGTSAIDYAICNTTLMQNIKFLIVKPPNYLSDHSQIITWLNIRKPINTKTNNNSDFSHKLPNQVIGENTSQRAYTDRSKFIK